MDGPPAQVTGGRRLTSQDWYLTKFNQLPQAGWVEVEVVAYSERSVTLG